MSKEVKQRKALDLNVYVLLVIMALFAMVLTWVVPAGIFDRETTDGVTRVIAGTYHRVEQMPQSPWSLAIAIVQGFIDRGALIFMIFFVGAAVRMLDKSQAINVAFVRMAKAVKGREQIAIFLIMLFMSIGGATGVFGNVTLVLIPVGIYLSQAMGFDKTLGFFMIFFGSFSGFNVGWANAGVLGLAQTIAELPMFSGIQVRIFFHIVNFALSYLFVLRYFYQIKKDPTKSLNYKTGMLKNDYMGSPDGEELVESKLSVAQILSLLALIVGIAVVIVGSLTLKWKPIHIAAVFLVVSLVIGLVNGWGANGTAKAFIKGCSDLVPAAFIVGFANAIMIMLNQGLILDTIVNALASPINRFGPVVGANFMLFVNTLISLLISSGSGQATTVMPIMVPVADLTGITRQVAVQTFQFGDGFTNCIVPTVGTLMGGLAFAGLGYGKYLKKVMPLIIIQIALAHVAITVLQMIGWTGL